MVFSSLAKAIRAGNEELYPGAKTSIFIGLYILLIVDIFPTKYFSYKSLQLCNILCVYIYIYPYDHLVNVFSDTITARVTSAGRKMQLI